MDKAKRKEYEQKMKEGTLTVEDMRDIIQDLRQGRLSAGFASKAAKEKKTRVKRKKQEDMCIGEEDES